MYLPFSDTNISLSYLNVNTKKVNTNTTRHAKCGQRILLFLHQLLYLTIFCLFHLTKIILR